MWRFGRRLVPVFTGVVLIWIFLWYSHDLVARLQETRARANETIAWFWAGTQVPLSSFAQSADIAVCTECGTALPTTIPASSSPLDRLCTNCERITRWVIITPPDAKERQRLVQNTTALFHELVQRLEYTTILTDTLLVPMVVNGKALPDSLPPLEMREYREMIQSLDETNSPVPITDLSGVVIGYLHYGADHLTKELTMVPYIELGMLVLLAGLFLLVIKMELKREKEMSWVSFAKETAHQISTPVSSMMGWLELLRESPGIDSDPELAEALDFMEKDVQRLTQIASRYGEMGKIPKLEPGQVNEVILATVHYLGGRPGFLRDSIELQTDLSSERSVELNAVLFSWVIENLLRNSLASLGGVGRGIIRITSKDLEEAGGIVQVEIADDGKGIPFRDQKRIFRAGFTTRRGGWGLGLTLSRRIVEEYHRGSIFLKASSPGKGAIFTIRLPMAKKTAE
jgi:signal transduction histidine kinase